LFEQTLVGKKPILTAAHRRLVCYCRLYEIYDMIKREKLTAHQREVYLFNDLVVITKLSGKKHQQFRQVFRLSGMNVYLFETPYYQYGIRLVRKIDMNEINLIIFNARNEHDRTKFCEDLKEAILEMNEMEGLRIQSEVDKLRNSSNSLVDITNNNGVVSSLIDYPTNKRERPLSRTLSNSLLDMTLNHQPLPCRTSQCSLDSGMVSLTNEFSPNNGILMR
jgi:IQ motif/SEC7 domain-containing protein